MDYFKNHIKSHGENALKNYEEYKINNAKKIRIKAATKDIKRKEKKRRKIEFLEKRIKELNQSLQNKNKVIIKTNNKIRKLSFYDSREWRELRYKVIKKHGRSCMACGSVERIHVDHIKPRSKYPELELDINNLQILCEDCNLGKSNIDETDWRT